jgi:hypothetical protein
MAWYDLKLAQKKYTLRHDLDDDPWVDMGVQTPRPEAVATVARRRRLHSHGGQGCRPRRCGSVLHGPLTRLPAYPHDIWS